MDRRQSFSGLLYLAGSALSAYFLLWLGALALFAGLAGRAFMNISPPSTLKGDNLEGLAATGAIMAASGLCLTIGLLILAFRRLSGRPYPRRHFAALYAVLSLGLVGVTTLVATKRTAPARPPAALAGLEGAWHSTNSDKTIYRFNPDGSLDSWYEGFSGGRFGSWTRSGQTVTIRTIRDWQITGTLTPNKIAGKMSKSSDGTPIGPDVWVRDVVP